MTDRAYRCAEASLARDEPLFGTASHVRRWLLLEQPGPWGPNGILDSRLPPRVVTELRSRARSAGVRVVLIRRGTRPSGPGRSCFFARTETEDTYLAELSLTKLEDVLDVDLERLGVGDVVDAIPRAAPLFLVCTHGRHDACCSIRGNQVSRVACADEGVSAWECSHIGGDRFAANVVSFPSGVYYGRVTPERVAELMHELHGGVLSLDHYRGRCCYPFHVQAAEYFLRRETHALQLPDVTLADVARTTHGATATFDLVDGRRAEVEIATTRGPEVYRLTCGSPDERPIPRYELVSLTFSQN